MLCSTSNNDFSKPNVTASGADVGGGLPSPSINLKVANGAVNTAKPQCDPTAAPQQSVPTKGHMRVTSVHIKNE